MFARAIVRKIVGVFIKVTHSGCLTGVTELLSSCFYAFLTCQLPSFHSADIVLTEFPSLQNRINFFQFLDSTVNCLSSTERKDVFRLGVLNLVVHMQKVQPLLFLFQLLKDL